MRPSEDIFILKLKNVKLLKVFNWQILCSDLYFEKKVIFCGIKNKLKVGKCLMDFAWI